jgi:hypothetical protein
MINIREASMTLSMGGTLSFFDNTAFWFADFPPNLDSPGMWCFRMDSFSTPSYLFKESVRYKTCSSFGARVRSRPRAFGIFYQISCHEWEGGRIAPCFEC